MIDYPTTAQTNRLSSTRSDFLFFVLLDFDSAPLYLCSAARNFDWNGHTWLGVGNITAMEPIVETITGEQVGTKLMLPGVSLDQRAMALQEVMALRECTVWVGFVDDSEQLIDNPIQEYKGICDYPEIVDNIDDEGKVISATVSINVENLMIDFQRSGKARRFTHEDQLDMYPGDMICQYVSETTEKSLAWGIPGWGQG